MNRLLKLFHYGKRGFTLIELLVVIGILSVLAVVIVPSIGGILSKGTLATANIEASTVRVAAIVCMVDKGGSAVGVVGPGRTGTGGDGVEIITHIDGPLKAKYHIDTSNLECIIVEATNVDWGNAIGSWNTTSCRWDAA